MILTNKKFIGIFISIILVIGLALPVFASAGLEVTKENGEKIVLFLNEESGKDSNDGITEEKAVKSLKKIKELFEEKIKEIKEDIDIQDEDVLKTIVVCSDELNEETKEKLKDEDIDVLTFEEYEKLKEEQEVTPAPEQKDEDKKETSPTPSIAPAVTEEPTVTPTADPSVTPSVSQGPTAEPSVTPSISEGPTAEPTVNPTVQPDKKTFKDNTDKNTNDEITGSEITPQAVEEDETVEAQNLSEKNTEEVTSDTATAQVNETAGQIAVMNDINAEAVNEQAVQAEAVNTTVLRSLPGRDLVGHGTTKTKTQSTAAATVNKQTTYNNSVTPTATTLAKGGSVQTGNEDNVLVYTVCACLSLCALVFAVLLSIEGKRRANNSMFKEEIEKFKDSIK